MLIIKNIRHSYNGQPLLKGIDFQLPDHEVLCLLGPSGSGKSTLLRIIAGLEEPEQGDVFWNGKIITATPVYQRHFGMVFQDYALFPHMTVFENVAFGLEMAKTDSRQIRQRVGSILEQVGMTGFEKRRVTELSGGEQQRIALARSLVVEPELLMLDEPLGALDHSLRQSLIEELRRIIRKKGISVIYVTHDQEEAFALADQVAILHEGVILQKGTPDEIFRRPTNIWCAGFLGLSNLIQGFPDENGMVCIHNFEKQAVIREMTHHNTGSTIQVLLNGGHFDRPETSDSIVLDGFVQDSIFRGTYYDIYVRVDHEVQIIVRNDNDAAAESAVRLYFSQDEICIYA